MHIRELVARTGISERQVRYLIAEGFMPPPAGGLALADYSDAHVEAIQRYLSLRELGFPPAAIRKLLEAKEGAPFPVAPGITLVVDPNLMTRRMAVEPILARLKAILAKIFKEPKNDKSSHREHD
jgi:MerR family transcriptional regulator, copper efflux regulator